MIAEGHWGTVYDLGDGTVAKVFRAEAHPDAVRYEYDVANLLNGLRLPTPATRELTVIDGKLTIIFDKIDGETMGEYVEKRPWKLFFATRQFADIHTKIHKIQLKGAQSIKRALHSRIRGGSELDEGMKSKIRSYLDTLEEDDRLCHFDFHPGNLMVENEQLHVIDWGGASQGPIIADVTHSYVLNKVGSISSDAPLWFSVLIRSMRRVYLELYLIHYARFSSDFSYRELKAGVNRWLLPIAAARLKSQDDFETPALMKIIRKSLWRAEDITVPPDCSQSSSELAQRNS